jgi:hypothetical protein
MTTTKYFYRAQTTVATINALVTKRSLAILASCLALLAPGIVSAAKPAASVDAECALLLAPDPQYVYTGTSLLVKLVRVPSYPGAFRNPEVSIDVTFPMSNGGESTQNYTVKIPKFNVTYVEHTFYVPPLSDGIVVGGEVGIEATVTELLSNKNGKKTSEKLTTCSTTATVVQSN